MNQKKSIARRFFFWIFLCFFCLVIVGIFYKSSSSSSGDMSFSPLFQLLGKVPKSLSRSVTRVLPIDSVDEGKLGEVIFKDYEANASQSDKKTLDYLSSLVQTLEIYKKKQFSYKIQILDSPFPNAMALPGGVILVTSGLLDILGSESELLAVLAHEMGHVELSHCFDSVKYEILSKKIFHTDLGKLADFSRGFLVRHSFSKTQEDEADSYGYKLLVNSQYDPTSVSRALGRLSFGIDNIKSDALLNPLRDYFTSHPPIKSRINKFSSEAKIWWNLNKGKKRYIGKKNFLERVPFSKKDFGDSEKVSSFIEN
jgi:predicted Zn-dependent protease